MTSSQTSLNMLPYLISRVGFPLPWQLNGSLLCIWLHEMSKTSFTSSTAFYIQYLKSRIPHAITEIIHSLNNRGVKAHGPSSVLQSSPLRHVDSLIWSPLWTSYLHQMYCPTLVNFTQTFIVTKLTNHRTEQEYLLSIKDGGKIMLYT